MKVISLQGSPRKNGNSASLADIITSSLAEKGHTIATYFLNTLNCRGCQACGACKSKSDICIIKDDLTSVLEEITEADVVIMGTPVYWGDISAQLKTLIDRTYSFLTPGFMTDAVKHRLPKGKKLVFIQTQGAAANLHNDIFDRYNAFFTMLNFYDETYLLRGCDVNEPGIARDRKDLVEKALEIADKL